MPPNLRAGVIVGAAIFHEGSLLLLRRVRGVRDFPGLWEFPGGSVEEGEGLEGALLREVREETGLSVTIDRPFHVSTFEADGQEGRRVTLLAVEFLCDIPSRGTVRLSAEEHDDFAWLRSENLPNYTLVPGFTRALAEAFRIHGTSTARG